MNFTLVIVIIPRELRMTYLARILTNNRPSSLSPLRVSTCERSETTSVGLRTTRRMTARGAASRPLAPPGSIAISSCQLPSEIKPIDATLHTRRKTLRLCTNQSMSRSSNGKLLSSISLRLTVAKTLHLTGAPLTHKIRRQS